MITVEDMKKLEAESGISPMQLMEQAGKSVASTINEQQPVKNKRILVVAYHGNNGGDGFVAAHHLSKEAEVDVLFIGDDDKFNQETATNYKRIENNERIQMLPLEAVDFSDYDIIIDAIFGTGIKGVVTDPLATLLKKLSAAKAFKVSIDVPSGVNPNTGEKSEAVFEPDLLISIHAVKKGLSKYKDKTIVADIGIIAS